MKILIIEDDQVVANIYRNKFALEGFQAETAPDGVVGLELVRTFRPDIVLLDLVLPRITGIEVMRQLRAQKDFEHIPVIVFSNTYLSNMVQEAWKAGATKCLSKANCTPKQVIEAVRSTLAPNSAGTTTAAPKKTVEKAPAPAVPPPEPDGKAEAEFQEQLRRDFIADLPNLLGVLRTLLQGLIKADNDAARVKQLQELYRRTRSLNSNAGIAGATRISIIAEGLEALFKELQEKPKNINASTLRTIASVIDFMSLLFERAGAPEKPFPPAEALVVDDEVISRRAIVFALDKANLKSTSVEDPLKALELVAHKKYDLVFLDVDMPNMTGFELCSKIRALPSYAKTPVVFVTGLNDLENRANSTMSGGNDFIAKPFLFIELTVKALVHVLRSRLDPK
ncbi:MAG TPA: response regulator [Verrucomicrobiae bacterium]|jgi:DNA-binding response OmpR family regulator|nr:response regulator [Verrucomicrobiae bacterium]